MNRGPKPSPKPVIPTVAGRPKPPSDLDEIALETFKGVCSDLEKQGTLTKTDARIIAGYARCFSMLQRIQAQIESEPLSSESNGRIFRHPLLADRLNYGAQERQYLNDLGLSPRTRGKTEEPEAEDTKWDIK